MRPLASRRDVFLGATLLLVLAAALFAREVLRVGKARREAIARETLARFAAAERASARFVTLSELVAAGVVEGPLDDEWVRVETLTRDGYRFAVIPWGTGWRVVANPVRRGVTGDASFQLDDTGAQPEVAGEDFPRETWWRYGMKGAWPGGGQDGVVFSSAAAPAGR